MFLIKGSNMSANPSSYSELEDAFITDANFKVDISQKMKVPHKISFNTELTNGDRSNAWVQDSINMHVPERILVAGQHQHIGNEPNKAKLTNSKIKLK